MKKKINVTSGQRGTDYTHVTIANHFDYSKWNNHQRAESTVSVFKIMDEFLGCDNLISRTRDFFRKSLIYYNNRPVLMYVNGDEVGPLDESQRVVYVNRNFNKLRIKHKSYSKSTKIYAFEQKICIHHSP